MKKTMILLLCICALGAYAQPDRDEPKRSENSPPNPPQNSGQITPFESLRRTNSAGDEFWIRMRFCPRARLRGLPPLSGDHRERGLTHLSRAACQQQGNGLDCPT